MQDCLQALHIAEKFHTYLENLSDNANKDDRMPFIGREAEMEAVLETLMRRLKHNVLLIGKSGVGKTALITEIASRINSGNVPNPLKGKIILEFALNQFFYSRDSVQELLKDLHELFSQILKQKNKIILFLDEVQLQSLPDQEKKSRHEQVNNVLRSYVSQRELNIIAAATPENYYKWIKHDEILSLNFCPVSLEEPGPEEMARILEGVAPYFESYYSLTIPHRLFPKIIFLLNHFRPHRAFPFKAIDLVDICCSRASLKQKKELDLDTIYQAVSDVSRLPLDIIKADPTEHRMNIRHYLEMEVINQRDAIEEISRIIKISGLEPVIDRPRPEGVFLFLGPAGVGKSFVARKIAAYLFGSPDKLRVIDVKDFKGREDFKKLISDNKHDPGILIEEIDRHPFSVILFENVADADEAVLNDLMKTVNKGEIIDASGKRHFTSNIIFILSLTSIGEEKYAAQIGFIKGDEYRYELIIPDKIDKVLDWVDEIIQFTPLSEEHLQLIADHKMKDIRREIREKYNSDVQVGEAVFDNISRESLAEGGFAHTVSEKLERQIKLKLLDMITKKSKLQQFEVTLHNNAIQIIQKK